MQKAQYKNETRLWGVAREKNERLERWYEGDKTSVYVGVCVCVWSEDEEEEEKQKKHKEQGAERMNDRRKVSAQVNAGQRQAVCYA